MKSERRQHEHSASGDQPPAEAAYVLTLVDQFWYGVGGMAGLAMIVMLWVQSDRSTPAGTLAEFREEMNEAQEEVRSAAGGLSGLQGALEQMQKQNQQRPGTGP